MSILCRLWIKWRFTNKRLVVTTNSPLLKREVQISYDKIKEIRTAPRAFGEQLGLWGPAMHSVVADVKLGQALSPHQTHTLQGPGATWSSF